MRSPASAFSNRRLSARIGVRRQRGSIIVFASLAISLVVIMLSVADIGFLYYYKREYQKAADLAAMAGARRLVSRDTGLRSCVGNAVPAAQQNAAQNLGARVYGITVDCGQWRPSANDAASRFDTGAASGQINAVRVQISGSPPRFLPFISPVTLTAQATALADQPLAQLTIRNGVASLNTANSQLLDGVVGGLLGGSVNLTSVGGWNGLLSTDINLLRYLDAMAVDLGLDVGDYDAVLGTQITLRRMLDVGADVLSRGGGTGSVNVALQGLNNLRAVNLPGMSQALTLGQLLNVQTGAPASALDLGLNLLDVVQGGVQLASGGRVATINLPVTIPGVASIAADVQVIEPPRLSAIGNPALAALDPYGPDRIFVRTAQVRALVSVNVSGVSNLLTQLTNAVSPLLSPIINFLNTAGFGGLNLLNAVGNLLKDVFELLLTVCNNNCSSRNAIYVEALAQPLQLSLDAAGADARVTDYDCANGKALTASGQTSVAHLRVGTINREAAFSSSALPAVSPVSLIEIGYRRVRPQRCFLLLGIGTCENEQWEQSGGAWLTNGKATARKYVISGLGLRANSSVGQSNYPALQYASPTLPELGDPPAYQMMSSSSVVSSLSNTLANIAIEPYQSNANGALGNLLNGTYSLLNDVVAALRAVVQNVLAGLLDPVVNSLMPLLGVNLATAEVGANLSCDGGGATLID